MTIETTEPDLSDRAKAMIEDLITGEIECEIEDEVKQALGQPDLVVEGHETGEIYDRYHAMKKARVDYLIDKIISIYRTNAADFMCELHDQVYGDSF